MVAKTFPLKKGYCHVDDEHLMISKSDQPYKVQNPKVNFVLIFFGVMLILTIIYAVLNVVNGNKNLALIYGIGAGIIGLNIVFNWNKNIDTLILIKDICKIEYKPASALTGDFFIVKYAVNGKVKQRILMLHRSASKDKKTLTIAKKALSTITDLS